MNGQRDLGVTLVCVTILMMSMVYLAQCSSRTPASPPISQTSVASPSAGAASVEKPGGSEAAERRDDEESVRIKSVAHALQTIGASPELRKTYGVDQ